MWTALLHDNGSYVILRAIWETKLYKKTKSLMQQKPVQKDLLFYEHNLRQKEA